jgi:hypothetical protein
MLWASSYGMMDLTCLPPPPYRIFLFIMKRWSEIIFKFYFPYESFTQRERGPKQKFHRERESQKIIGLRLYQKPKKENCFRVICWPLEKKYTLATLRSICSLWQYYFPAERRMISWQNLYIFEMNVYHPLSVFMNHPIFSMSWTK